MSELRQRLADARLMLIFTPALCRDPRELLDALAPEVDVIQVRIKRSDLPLAASPAAELYDWCARTLELVAQASPAPLVLVNDRVDVARALLARGLAGAHLGQDDCPPAAARGLLGERALLGRSTHSPSQVVATGDLPLDYIGFGPVFATKTKGYARGLGPEAAWVATLATPLPAFGIGGIDQHNAHELTRVGRAAVSRALLAAEDPVATARALRAALGG